MEGVGLRFCAFLSLTSLVCDSCMPLRALCALQELCRVLFDRLEDAFKGTPNETLVNDLYQGRMVDYLETIG